MKYALSETTSNDWVQGPQSIYLVQGSHDGSSSPKIDNARIKKKDLKIEGPLTPPPAPVLSKTVTFNDVVEQMLLDPWSSPSLDVNTPKFFEEAFGAIAEVVNRQVEQERLITADAIGRVKIPLMDFSAERPPWRIFQHSMDTDTTVLTQRVVVRELMPSTIPEWIATMPHAMLRWNPFPHNLGEMALVDQIDYDDNVFKSYLSMETAECITQSSDLAWKPSGLRILKEDEDLEEELEPYLFTTTAISDIGDLVKLRKSEIEQGELFSKSTRNTHTCVSADDSGHSSGPTLHSVAEKVSTKRQNPERSQNDISTFPVGASQLGQLSPGRGDILDGLFAVTNSLDSFLELRGVKRQKVTTSTSSAREFNFKSPRDESTHSAGPLVKTQKVIQRSNIVLPAPSIVNPETPTSIIVSSDIFRHNRSLVRSIYNLLPSLTVIERDFQRYEGISWNSNPSIISATSSLVFEVDIIISPPVGLIITSLQKIQQKPLPGQGCKSAFYDKLEKVSLKYEKIIILISEGREDEATYGLEEYSCLAITQLTGFTQGLDAHFTLCFVGGGQETLLKWIASCIAQHRFIGGDGLGMPLLEEETHWEVFLRRAGLNSFAAQIIISQLKSAEGCDNADSECTILSGLTAFVTMTKQERMDKFEKVLGGKRILSRVSDVIDAGWK